MGRHVLSGADLQSILQLSIPCLCLYQSYHRTIITLPIPLPSTTYLLWDNGNLPQRINLEHISPLQHRPLESILLLLPKPDITGDLCEHCTLHLQTCPSAVPSCPNHFFKKLKLSDKISSSTTYAQNVLGESHLHLAPPPLQTQGSQSPAHARARHTHLCAESSLRTHNLDFDLLCA